MDNMKKPTEKQIKAKINILDKQRMKLSRETNTLEGLLRNKAQDEEVKKILKFKYLKALHTNEKSDIQLFYIHSITIKKKDPMTSIAKGVLVFRDTISCGEYMLYSLRGYKPVHQDVFVQAYGNVMKKIDMMLPLIKKTKVGL